MILSDELKIRLLGAIDTGSLVFLCGAGLSMAPPSSLPSAASVADSCYQKWLPNETLAPELQYDPDALAGHFYAKGEFESVFVNLVPWNDLAGEPNDGHAAIADMLVCRAAHGAMSANFDTMIERWAVQRKIAMRGALDGQDAVNFTPTSNPLLKFHGCMDRDRERTLWTQSQLPEAVIDARVKSCSQWMALNLPGKHLVVVGFWTDWGYLNQVLANAFTITNAQSVIVIDPSPSDVLEQKAPILWEKLNALSGSFDHIQQSGDEFLGELRSAFSKSWARKFYALGAPQALSAGITATPDIDALNCDELYDLRRDAEGVSYSRAGTCREPHASAAAAAFSHFDLLEKGAVQKGAWLTIGGQKVRIVNGAGRGVDDMRQKYKEPATIEQPDIMLCAGAVDYGVPGRLISAGAGKSIVSPAPGADAKWLTNAELNAELGL